MTLQKVNVPENSYLGYYILHFPFTLFVVVTQNAKSMKKQDFLDTMNDVINYAWWLWWYTMVELDSCCGPWYTTVELAG